MAPGFPVNNFFFSSPLTSATLVSNEGIYHGGNVSTAQKYLKRLMACSSSAPLTLQMNDILLYYPAIDGDSTDEQTLINSVSYSRVSPNVVQAYLVAQGSYTGGNQFFLTYTYGTLASAGVSAGTFGWAIPLAFGDTGITSVQSIQFLTAGGGIFALVLAAPIGTMTIVEANVPTEKDFLIDNGLSMPEIKDGAFLGFLGCPTGSLAAVPIYGVANFVWG
jgi:hypothetical protein